MSAPAPARAARPPLAERLGVGGAPEAAASFAARLAETARQAHEALEARGLLLPTAPHPPALALPHALAELLEVALTAARRDGPEGHAEALELQLLDALPGARAHQLATAEAPNAWLFHTPLPWAELPRMRAALDDLAARVHASGLDPVALWGPSTLAALGGAAVALGPLYEETYYGALQPMFRALPHDLAPLAEAPAALRWEAVDRLMTGPLLHELAHFGRHRDALYPPYVDEALAGYFGTLAYRASAFPDPGDDGALIGWPWFTQVGQALARAFGHDAVWRAHAGAVPWDAVLPQRLLDALERHAWAAYRAAPSTHFHPDMTRPDRWVRLIYAAARDLPLDDLDALEALPWSAFALAPAPNLDREILAHALAALGLAARQLPSGTWRVALAPPPGPVTLDFDRGVAHAPPRHDGVELAPAAHALPPLARAGRLTLTLDDLTAPALDALAAELLAGY